MRWIPVSERLPTHPYSVLGWVTKGGLVIPDERGMRDIVTYFPKTGRWHQPVDGGDAHVEVSHWMDLPAPPGGFVPGASSDDEEAPAAVTALDLTLTQEEAGGLAAFLDDDLEVGDDAVRLLIGDGHSGYGLYASHPEYPDEGAILIKELPNPCGVVVPDDKTFCTGKSKP